MTIKRKRLDKGIRQVDMATYLGIKRSTYEAIENYRRYPSNINIIESISKILGLCITDVLCI